MEVDGAVIGRYWRGVGRSTDARIHHAKRSDGVAFATRPGLAEAGVWQLSTAALS